MDNETLPASSFSDQDGPQISTAHVEVLPFPPIQPKTSFEVLTNYWNNILTPAQRTQGTVYLYRLDPKMLLVAGRGGRPVNANCEKFNEEDGPITRELIRSRRRMGVYLLRLNQRVVKPSCEISNCEVEIHGDLTDPNDMPILDVGNLDLSCEGNKDYIRVLRSRGSIKADAQETEGEEMVTAQVLDKALDMLGNQQQQQPQPQQPATDLAGVVGPIISLLDKQINQNRAPSEQGTVLEMVEALTKISKANAPAAVDLSPFIALQQQNNALVERMMQKDVERAEAEAKKAREEAESYKAAMPKPKSLREELREMRELQEEYNAAVSGKPVDEDEEDKADAPTAAGFLGTIAGSLPVIERIMGHAASMLYNYKLNGAGATPLNPATHQPDTRPLPPQVSQPPEDEPETAVDPKEQARIDHMQNVVNQLSALEKPMIKFFLDPSKTGRDFAQFTLQNFGQDSFATVGSVGKQGLLNMLSQYPPVWDIVGSTIQEFSKFLDEFLAYQPTPVQ